MKRVQAVIKPERLDPIQHKLLIDLLVEDDEVAPVVAIIREEAKTALEPPIHLPATLEKRSRNTAREICDLDRSEEVFGWIQAIRRGCSWPPPWCSS